jgi:putative tRNA adenosine deaminase-associated protein
VTHSAYVLAKSGTKWRGDELDLHEVEDLDELSDMMRDFADASVTLVFIEEDDEYVAIARVDGEEEEARGFISDARCLDAATLAARIFEGALELPSSFDEDSGDEDEDGEESDEDEDDESEAPEIEPAGDTSVLSDLGVPEKDLLAWCSAEGNLPADVISSICERLGALDELERIRGL